MNASTIDRAVDQFVTVVNNSRRSVKLQDEIAPSVAEPSTEDPDYWEWSIRRTDTSWIPEVEQRLPHAFPAIFRSLVSRYIFPAFEWRKVSFFANTPEKIGYEGHELRVAIFRDARLFDVLASNGYTQFGQPATGSYDPVCFGPTDRSGIDAPVVRLDHEDILIRGKIRQVQLLAPSFNQLISAPAAQLGRSSGHGAAPC
jgi:hypothetical protein